MTSPAARRHLPVLQGPATPAPATPAASSGDAAEPPAWHWIPMGTVISVVAFALLAQGAAALSVRLLGRVYPPHATPAQIAAIRASRGASAVATELAAGAVPLAALVASVALGGFVIGRWGERTNARHGTLSGLVTAGLFWAVTGRLPTLLAVVPVAMVAGWAAARWGATRRAP